jgi:hypothetical protein
VFVVYEEKVEASKGDSPKDDRVGEWIATTSLQIEIKRLIRYRTASPGVCFGSDGVIYE